MKEHNYFIFISQLSISIHGTKQSHARDVTGTERTESSTGWGVAKDDLVRLRNPIRGGKCPEYMLLTLQRKRVQTIQE
jgi:hypothetical protein